LIAARGHGTALSILPDAREFLALDSGHHLEEPKPLYGRGPDAKLPGKAA